MSNGSFNTHIHSLNYWYWEDLAKLHFDKCSQQTLDLLDGKQTLRHIELEEVGGVRDKELLHLMCHLGHDSISWARLGARVVAVDASKLALSFASRTAIQAGVAVDFKRLFIPALPYSWRSRFDVIVMTYGTLAWLPDLSAWAKSCAVCLAPGGRLVVVDDHPLADSLRRLSDGQALEFDETLARVESGSVRRHRTSGSYIDRRAQVTTPYHFRWNHSISALRSAIAFAGLSIVRLGEYPFTHYERFPELVLRSDSYFEPREKLACPLMFSLLARKAT